MKSRNFLQYTDKRKKRIMDYAVKRKWILKKFYKKYKAPITCRNTNALQPGLGCWSLLYLDTSKWKNCSCEFSNAQSTDPITYRPNTAVLPKPHMFATLWNSGEKWLDDIDMAVIMLKIYRTQGHCTVCSESTCALFKEDYCYIAWKQQLSTISTSINSTKKSPSESRYIFARLFFIFNRELLQQAGATEEELLEFYL